VGAGFVLNLRWAVAILWLLGKAPGHGRAGSQGLFARQVADSFRGRISIWAVVLGRRETVNSACSTALLAAAEELVSMLGTSSPARFVKGRREAPRGISEFAGRHTNER
jgi:hypothetical protein